MKHARATLFCGLLGHLAVAVAIALLGAGRAAAQEETIKCEDVPAPVRSAFGDAYPKAAINSCAKEVEKGETAFEISSRDGSTTRDILYRPDGKVIVVEESIPISGLPEAVRQAVDTKRPGRAIAFAEKLTRDGATNYEIHFKSRRPGQGAASDELIVDSSGNEVPQ